MSKRLIWLLALLVTLALVVGCTGAATPAAEKPAATEAPKAEAPAATEEAAAEAPATEAPAATEEAAATEAPAATEEAAAEAPTEGCTDAIGCVEIAAGDPIHIAWISTVSGGTAPLGTDNNRGVEIAIDDKGGELLGHPIELTGEDSLCSAEGGQTAGTKIASDPTVVGIVGTTCSSEARAAMPLIAEAGMVMISPSNTNPDLTNPEHPDHHPGYLRTAHNDLFQGRIAAEFAFNELGLKTAATIHDGSPYAESLQRVFAEVFTELGGTITSQEAINVGDTDMKGVLTKIGADKPGIIYFPIFEPEGDFIAAQKCDVADLKDTLMMGADGLTIDTFPEAAGECAVGMFLSGPYVQGQPYDDFVAKYEEKYGEKPVSGFHAHAYDGANMIFQAIEQVAVQNEDGSLSIGRQALRDAMYGIKDFDGLTGKLSCDEYGDCATGEAIAVFQLTEAEVVDGAWPPKPYWLPGGGKAPAAEGGEEAAGPTTIPAGTFTCEDEVGCVDIAAGDPIHVAWIQTVSGATSPLGSDQVRGVELAVDDKGGELLGHPLELTGEDSLCSAEGGQAAGTKIAADPTIVGIVGTSCSSEARAAMPLISEAGMVMISGSNTNPDLTNPEHPDHHPGYLRTAHNDLFQGRIAAEFAFNELGFTTAATIHDGSPYAESLQQVFAEVFKELGGTITSQEAVNVGDTDMKGVLTKIGADKPQIIYFPIFEPESGFITAQKCDVPDLADTVLMSADGSLSDTFPEAAGECAENMYLSGPFVQGQPYDDFVAKYAEKYGENPISGFHAHAYDGANMIFDAIQKVAVLEDDGTLHIGRQALRDAMYATKDFEGLTGKLSCDKNGDCATGEAIAVFQLTKAEILDGAWPPPPFWLPGGGEAAPAEGESEAPAAEAAEAMAPPECTELTPVSLQLQWVAQSQFAGYYAAKAKGFFEEFCLDVTILEGAVDIVPQQVVASGQAQFGIAWVPKVLASREEGADLVNIAQVFQRSGTLEVSWADAPVATVADMKGKKIGTWGFGNEHELFAAMRKEGLDPNNPDDVKIIQQSFDMLALLNRELDAAEAMTYNEYAQVLEAENPETGELYQPEDLVVINFNDVGTAMLQDHVFVDGKWLAEEGNEQIATQFLAAAFKGWQFCRDSFDECVQIVLDNGPTLGKGHMTWQLNEINKLIWPSPKGIGVMDPALWEQTATISVEGGVIKEAPGDGAYRTDLAEAAQKYLSGDITGESWTAQEVEVTAGGE